MHKQKRRGLWPLPGGVESYFDSLITILRFVGTENPRAEQLEEFLQRTYGVEGNTAVKGYVRVLAALGCTQLQGDTIDLTTDGREVTESRAAIKVYRSLDERFIGIHAVLEICKEEGLKLRDVHERLKSRLGVRWETTNQTFFRTCWLRSLGMLQTNLSGVFELTEAGRVELEGRGVSPEPDAARTVVVPDDPELSGGEQFLADLEAAARAGGNGRALEEAVAEAFRRLGFESRLIGGSSEPDVVLQARQGLHTFKAVVDAKSTTRGVVPESQINWESIQDHRVRVKASAALVVGIAFAGGNLISRAEDKDVRLMRVDQLAGLLRNHEATPLGVDVFTRILLGGGIVEDDDLEKLAQRAEELATWPSAIGAVFEAVWRKQAERGARLDANALYFVLEEEFDPDQIHSAVDLLCHDAIRGLDRDDEGSLRTLCSPETLRSRLERMSEALPDGPPKP